MTSKSFSQRMCSAIIILLDNPPFLCLILKVVSSTSLSSTKPSTIQHEHQTACGVHRLTVWSEFPGLRLLSVSAPIRRLISIIDSRYYFELCTSRPHLGYIYHLNRLRQVDILGRQIFYQTPFRWAKRRLFFLFVLVFFWGGMGGSFLLFLFVWFFLFFLVARAGTC